MLLTNITRMNRRSERTRARLQTVALDLISRQGFDGTTVAEIAAGADVSHMTFFRHFATKESVLLDDPYDPVLAEAVHAQPSDLPPLERVRRALLAAWAALPEPGESETRARLALVVAHPGLRAAALENNRRTEDALVEALLADGTDRLTARVAAGAVLGALTAALFDWGSDDGGQPLGDRIAQAMAQLAPADGTAR